MSMKNSNDATGNRTRDLPAWAQCLNQLRHREQIEVHCFCHATTMFWLCEASDFYGSSHQWYYVSHSLVTKTHRGVRVLIHRNALFILTANELNLNSSKVSVIIMWYYKVVGDSVFWLQDVLLPVGKNTATNINLQGQFSLSSECRTLRDGHEATKREFCPTSTSG